MLHSECSGTFALDTGPARSIKQHQEGSSNRDDRFTMLARAGRAFTVSGQTVARPRVVGDDSASYEQQVPTLSRLITAVEPFSDACGPLSTRLRFRAQVYMQSLWTQLFKTERKPGRHRRSTCTI